MDGWFERAIIIHMVLIHTLPPLQKKGGVGGGRGDYILWFGSVVFGVVKRGEEKRWEEKE